MSKTNKKSKSEKEKSIAPSGPDYVPDDKRDNIDPDRRQTKLSEEDEKLRINLKGLMERSFAKSEEEMPLNINLVIRKGGTKDGELLLPLEFKYWRREGPIETQWKTKPGEPQRDTYRYVLKFKDGKLYSMISGGYAIFEQSKLLSMGKTVILDANKKGWKFFRL